MRSCIKCSKKFSYTSRFKLYEIKCNNCGTVYMKNSKISIWIANIIATVLTVYTLGSFTQNIQGKVWVLVLLGLFWIVFYKVTILICDFFIEYKEVYQKD